MGVVSVGLNEAKVISYARFVCALNLDYISSILKNSWTFSIELDMSTHMSVSYLDICIYVFVEGLIHNFCMINQGHCLLTLGVLWKRQSLPFCRDLQTYSMERSQQ